jgi:hypothetical protein
MEHLMELRPPTEFLAWRQSPAARNGSITIGFSFSSSIEEAVSNPFFTPHPWSEGSLEKLIDPATRSISCACAACRARLQGCVLDQMLLPGYEAMPMIRKGQVRWVSGNDVRRQIQFIQKLFELPV